MRKHHPALSFGLFLLTLALAGLPSAQAQDYTPSTPAPSSAYQDYSHARIVRLSLVDGDVQILRPEAQTWEDALLNLPLQQGYSLATGRGRAEVELESGATIRVAEDSMLEFTELALGDGARITRLSLTQGTATFYANLGRHDVFTVATPFLDVAIPDDARFRLDVYAGGSKVAVLKGKVTVETGAETYRLAKGRSLIFQQAATAPVTLARNAEPDEWDRWVADRDEVVTTAQRNSRRYVNAPFRYGLADLTSYGLWYRDPFYGYVWQPYGISYGWTPYLSGRWVFSRGLGWTWVSFEPWGWVPYHHGRWALTSRGWVWLPSGLHRWHPGLVAWTHIGNHVGWCPLGPRDHVGGRFHRPQGGVVITNTPSGVVGGSPNVSTHVTREDTLRFASEPQFGGRFRGPRTADFEPQEGREGQTRAGFTGSAGNRPTAAPSQPGSVTPRPQPADAPGIVFDPEEQRFVNNPRVPTRPAAVDRDAAGGSVGVVRGRPAPASSARPAAASRDSRPDATRPTTPQRPSWGSRSQPPRTQPRATQPPRTTRPQTNPPPRAGTARPSTPPPRATSPRPAPRPRATPPRPAPRPRSSGWGSSSRPSPRSRAQSPSRTRPTRSQPPRQRQRPQGNG